MLKTFSCSATTPLDVEQTWELLTNLTNWQTCSDVYAEIAWSGPPWKAGSCIVGNLQYPVGMAFRYVVQTCHAPHEITYLAHGLDPASMSHRIVQLNLEKAKNGTSIRVKSFVLGEPTTPRGSANNLKAITDRWLKGFIEFCASHENQPSAASV